MFVIESDTIQTNCPNCGGELKKGEQICKYCGTDVSRKEIINLTPLTSITTCTVHMIVNEDEFENLNTDDYKKDFVDALTNEVRKCIEKNIEFNALVSSDNGKEKEYKIWSKVYLSFNREKWG